MNKLNKTTLFSFLLFFFVMNLNANSLSSPNGKIKVMFQLNTQGEPAYTVSRNKEVLIQNSPLGLVTKEDDFAKNLNIVSVKNKKISDQYTLLSGKQTQLKAVCNQMDIALQNDKNNAFKIQFRAFNDGVAFRYVINENQQKKSEILDELSSFAVPQNTTMWIMPYDTISMYTPAYETFYTNGVTVQTKSPNNEGWSFPALFRTSQSWMLITEADLTENYCASHLHGVAENGRFRLRFPEKAEALGNFAVNPTIHFPFNSPWRVITIGSNCGEIMQSNLVTHLSKPTEIAEQSWIKPGKSSWSWWSDHDSPRNYESLKKFVDFSAEMGWEYSLVDANWDLMTGGNVNQLIDYAATKHVGIWLWYNSGGKNNVVTERPRDVLFHAETRLKEFEKISKWGVKGVKIDFFQSDKQEIVKLYLDILRDAAKHKIMVNFHGCTLPRGWQRTYPNLLTMEAVRGAENYGFDANYPAKAPWHNTIYPFTRNVIGSMDYTPVTLSNQQFPHLTTDAHELALSIVYESGMQHFADKVEAYSALNNDCKQFLQSLPVSWDETKCLAGEPGKYVVVARRKGKKWYVGGINGQNTAQEISIDLSKYKIKNVIVDNSNLTPQPLKAILKMEKAGGFVAF